jgi:hypothetical protein
MDLCLRTAVFGLSLPIAIAGGIIAAIAAFALTVTPPNQQNQSLADRPGISTDLDTTGQAIPKR